MGLIKCVDHLKRVDDLIRRKATGNPDAFAERMPISRSQPLQDLSELCENGSPIELDSKRRGYYYSTDYVLSQGFPRDGYYVRGGMSPFHSSFFAFTNVLVTALIMAFASQAYSQISGFIINSKSKKPIADVEIFIQGKSISTGSNLQGYFSLNGIPTGLVDIVLYKHGYRIFKSSLRLATGKAYSLNLAMNPEKEPRIVMSRNDYQIHMSELKASLFGETHVSEYALLNEKTVSFGVINNEWRVMADEPLIIENLTLGYQIRYYLAYSKFTEDHIDLNGYVTYIPMQPQGSEQMIRWARDRHKAYNGSLRHLLKAIVNEKCEAEGFELTESNGERVNCSSLVRSSISNFYSLMLKDTLNIRYVREDGEVENSKLIPLGPLHFSNEGLLLVPENLEVRGQMKEVGAIGLLPDDYIYVKPNLKDLLRYKEQIYIQTDKPYYYPGDPLWFKGYVRYFSPSIRDSLSKVVYFEVINTKERLVTSLKLKIESGVFRGDIILPDTLSPGNYYLRAYTQLSRNYGAAGYFVRPISILRMTDKADPSQASYDLDSNNGLTVIADKLKYRTRERITLTIRLNDHDTSPEESNLSISVTDAVQVIQRSESLTILNGYQMDTIDGLDNIEFKYPCEFGFGYSGRFLNEKAKGEKTTLTILQMRPRSVSFIETDDNGLFYHSGLHFYDTTSLYFKSDKANETPYGKVEILPSEFPSFTYKGISSNLNIQETKTAQRLISEYEVPKGDRLLDSIEVKASRLPMDESEEPDYRIKRPYGKPNYVLKAKDINTSYGNLLYAMQGRFPGLIVRQTESGWEVSSVRSLSIQSPTPVLVTVNDVVVGGNPADILASINPNTVESIEVTTRVNVLYGSAGANGVISIHTKEGVSDESKRPQNFQRLTLLGFSKNRAFEFPRYDDPSFDRSKADYRATIYWNPDVRISSTTGFATLSFYAADLPGAYFAIVEGTTASGRVLRSTLKFDVTEN